MSTPHRVRINLNAAGVGSVSVDGAELHVREVQIFGSVGEATRVVLCLVNCKIEIDVDGYVFAVASSVDIGDARMRFAVLDSTSGKH